MEDGEDGGPSKEIVRGRGLRNALLVLAAKVLLDLIEEAIWVIARPQVAHEVRGFGAGLYNAIAAVEPDYGAVCLLVVGVNLLLLESPADEGLYHGDRGSGLVPACVECSPALGCRHDLDDPVVQVPPISRGPEPECPGPLTYTTLLAGVVLDGEAVADHAGAVQVLGVQAAPALEGEGAVPARAVAPERDEASASAPPLPVGAVNQAVLLPLQQDGGGLYQPLEVPASDLRGDAPTQGLPLPLQPCLDPSPVEVAASGLVVEPQQAARDRVVELRRRMRQGELLALKWDDVDLEGGRLRVRHTLTHEDKSYVLGEPKTPKSRRTIRLTTNAVTALRDHLARQLEEMERMSSLYQPGGLIFATEAGTIINPSNLRNRSFKPLLRRAGLRQIRFHDLRHTCATLLLSKNINVKVVSEMLGHSSISVTLDIYSHLLPDMQEKAVEALEEMLR